MTQTVPVSVVIPCYRCAHTIARAVGSVAGQTALPLELILVDDGSADETRSVLNELRNRYAPNWIKLLLLDQNVGAASARNAGWDMAAGRYIAFLDADDSWHPHKLQLQYAFMLSEPDVAVCGHGHHQIANSPKSLVLGQPVFQILPAFYVLLKNPFITPSFMVRAELPIRFLTGRRHMEDHLFLMRVTTSGLQIAKTRTPLAFIYKNIFGDAGLSADLWVMQRRALENYDILRCERGISQATSIFLKTYSWLKFFRRYLIVIARKLQRTVNQ